MCFSSLFGRQLNYRFTPQDIRSADEPDRHHQEGEGFRDAAMPHAGCLRIPSTSRTAAQVPQESMQPALRFGMPIMSA